jgi:CubicO group peptidase (beta-lactamase class C family)
VAVPGEEPPAAAVQPAAEVLPTDPRYAAAAEYSASRGGHALLVVAGEAIVFEAGQNGHAARAPHPLLGGSTSFWGVAAVAAESDGLLDLDEPVHSTLPEFADPPWRSQMRVRHLLEYTSGLEPGVTELASDASEDRVARALALGMVAPPGERFQYGPSHLLVFGEVLRRKLVTEEPLAYLERRILDPIGLEVADWKRDAAGGVDLASGASLSAREWAKFGRLVRNGGRWQGATVVDAEALAACFEPSAAFPGHGLAFWLNRSEPVAAERPAWDARSRAQAFYPDGLPDLVVAAGADNQRLYVIPSLDLVVVRFGGRDPRWRDAEFLAHVVEAGARPVAGRSPPP